MLWMEYIPSYLEVENLHSIVIALTETMRQSQLQVVELVQDMFNIGMGLFLYVMLFQLKGNKE